MLELTALNTPDTELLIHLKLATTSKYLPQVTPFHCVSAGLVESGKRLKFSTINFVQCLQLNRFFAGNQMFRTMCS